MAKQIDSLNYQVPHTIGGESDNHGIALSTECPPDCSGPGRHCFNGGPKKFYNSIDALITERPDTWRVICKAFVVKDEVILAIEDNSADAKVRCIDVIHFVYHHYTNISLDVVEDTVRNIDPHLANAISNVKPLVMNKGNSGSDK